ncbi:MAG: DUF6153 family protein [Pseudonocardia sp.]
MDGNGRGWQRALLVVAVMLGVAAMHTTVAPAGADPCAGSGALRAGTHAGVHPHGSAGVHLPGSGDCHPLHQLLHLCLAVLAAGALLLGLNRVTWSSAEAGRLAGAGAGGTAPARPRAPPTVPDNGERLARLCVSRT